MNEPATSGVSYGETLSYELGSVSSGMSSGTQHEVLMTKLTSDTTYNFQKLEDANRAETLPVINLWYGTTQEFGVTGTPQKWVNVLGDVSDPDGIASLRYSLNGSSATALSIGSDIYRLAKSGDFNIDIDRSSLLVGANTLIITAVDNLGYSTAQNVTVNYYDGSVWPSTYSIDWAKAGSIQNVAQVVDGTWKLSSTGVRTVDMGYDRLIAIGDVNWTDYEITVPLTVYSINDPAGFASPSNGPGVGLLMRWVGHYDIGVTQPNIGWRPLGALGWYRWRSLTNQKLMLMGSRGETLDTDTSGQQLQFGLTYMMKMRVETNVDQKSTFSLRWWEAGQAEPTGWDLRGSGDSTTLQNGSLMLVAHHVDVEFGNISIIPMNIVGAVIGNITEQITTDAIITWTTEEPTTVTLQYGEDTSYGLTISDPAFNTNHSMTISGLPPGQTVHYEITVVDAGGNVTTTRDRSFITHKVAIEDLEEPPLNK